MKIWLDDVREMPEGFDIHCRNSSETIGRILSGEVDHISFDHDLGEFSDSGYWVAKFIESMAHDKRIPTITWEIHSANPIGRKDIEMAMKSAERFWNS